MFALRCSATPNRPSPLCQCWGLLRWLLVSAIARYSLVSAFVCVCLFYVFWLKVRSVLPLEGFPLLWSFKDVAFWARFAAVVLLCVCVCVCLVLVVVEARYVVFGFPPLSVCGVGVWSPCHRPCFCVCLVCQSLWSSGAARL